MSKDNIIISTELKDRKKKVAKFERGKRKNRMEFFKWCLLFSQSPFTCSMATLMS